MKIKVTEEMTKERYWQALSATECVELGAKIAAAHIDKLQYDNDATNINFDEGYQEGWDEGYAQAKRDSEYD